MHRVQSRRTTALNSHASGRLNAQWIDRRLIFQLFIIVLAPSVANPLPHIAVHVEQTKRIGFKRSDGIRAEFDLITESGSASERRFIVTGPVRSGGPRAACELPFGFRGKAIRIGRRLTG